MLSIIEKIIMANGYPYLRLDGSISQYERTRMCNLFNADYFENPSFAFLVSTKAGGVGLNLTGATKVRVAFLSLDCEFWSHISMHVHSNASEFPITAFIQNPPRLL